MTAARELQMLGIKHIVFQEDDLNGQSTSIATQPVSKTQRKQLAHWKLWK